MQPELLFPDDEDELPRRSPAPGLRSVVLACCAALVGVVLIGSVVGREQPTPARPSPSLFTPSRAAPTFVAPSPVAENNNGQLAYASDVDCQGRCIDQLAVPASFVAAVRTLYPHLHLLWAKTSLLRPARRGERSTLYYEEITARQGRASIFVRVLAARPRDRNQTLMIRGAHDTLTEVQVRIGARVVQVGVDSYGTVPSASRLRALAHDARLAMT